MNIKKIFLYINKYFLIFILLNFSFLIFFTIYFFSIKQVVKNLARVSNNKKTSISSITFSKNRKEKNKNMFYYLNDDFLIYDSKNKIIRSNFFMTNNEEKYNLDYIDFYENYLEEKECIISNDLAKNFNIYIGEKIKIESLSMEFTVSKIISSFPGISENFLSGIVIIKYNSEIREKINSPTYIYFLGENDDFPIDSYDIISIKAKTKEEYKLILIKTSYILLIVVIVIIDFFIFYKYNLNDYMIDKNDGKKKKKILLNIFLFRLMYYFLPTIIYFVMFYFTEVKNYLNHYFYFNLFLLSITLFLSIFLSLLFNQFIFLKNEIKENKIRKRYFYGKYN